MEEKKEVGERRKERMYGVLFFLQLDRVSGALVWRCWCGHSHCVSVAKISGSGVGGECGRASVSGGEWRCTVLYEDGREFSRLPRKQSVEPQQFQHILYVIKM